MTHSPDRRRWLNAAALALLASPLAGQANAAASAVKPFRILAITFRGRTEVEKGFEEYFAARKVPVEIIYRDIARDATKLPAILEEARALKPNLIYTWGTSVTLGVVGPFDGVAKDKHITDTPVVFTMVAAPIQAKIVEDRASSRRNVTGVMHVVPTEAQMHAMSSYRPFQTLGVLYTPTERNSVVILEEIRRIGRDKGFHTVERTFRLDANRQPIADGAADMVRELKEGGAQWLYLPPDSFLGTQAEGLIVPAAMALGLPTFASTEQLMQAGALSGLVARYYSVGQFTAHKAEQILVAKVAPSAIPVEALKRFSYQIRMPAARALNLPPPLPMLGYAELIGNDKVPIL